MRKLIIALATALLALALATGALAGSGQKSKGYVGPGEAVQGQVQQGQEGVAGAETGGALPFTGVELTLLVIGGAALVLTGSGFYRLSRRRQ